MVSVAGVLAALLYLLGGLAASGMLVALARHARALHGTAKFAGRLNVAIAILPLIALVRAATTLAGFANGVLTAVIAALDVAAALSVVGFFSRAQAARHGGKPGSLATFVFLATGAGAALFVTAPDSGLRLAGFAIGLSAGAWAAAFAAARNHARLEGAPAWAPGFALAGAYLLVLGAYFRAFLFNAAAQNASLFDWARLESAVVFLLALAFAWPAIDSVSKGIRAAEIKEASDLAA